ncbi:ATP-dependent zinc protease [Coxiella endosymbiont of Amblyomma sculptum]|nr:ATP-dependent zinc protease [Coxiella endosymbiont of Amblyomma sculptum]
MILGWREWIALPDLGIDRIKAKIDTGARTSVLHAFSVKIFHRKPCNCLHFRLYPIQKNDQVMVACKANILDRRFVTNSGGCKELRYAIRTNVILGNRRWSIEITLTNRDKMGFRMLLGRSALQNTVVNPSRSFIASYKDFIQ